jgi:hypothetical protein
VRAKAYALLPESARCHAVGVEAHQFTRDPHARLQHISIWGLVGVGSSCLNRLALRVERACAAPASTSDQAVWSTPLDFTRVSLFANMRMRSPSKGT